MGYPSVGILYKFIVPQIVSLTPADCFFKVPQISQIYTEHSDDNGENLCESVKSVGLKNNLWDKESVKPKNLCESVKSVGLKKNNP